MRRLGLVVFLVACSTDPTSPSADGGPAAIQCGDLRCQPNEYCFVIDCDKAAADQGLCKLGSTYRCDDLYTCSSDPTCACIAKWRPMGVCGCVEPRTAHCLVI